MGVLYAALSSGAEYSNSIECAFSCTTDEGSRELIRVIRAHFYHHRAIAMLLTRDIPVGLTSGDVRLCVRSARSATGRATRARFRPRLSRAAVVV